jgi:hypothetical protein
MAVGGNPASLASSMRISSNWLNVFAVFRRKRAQLDIQRFEPRLAGGVEFRAVPPEVVHGLGQKSFACACQRLGFIGRGVVLHGFPQPLIQWNAGIKRADDRLHGVVRRAQFRISGDAFEMLHYRHGEIQTFGHVVERQHGVFERARFCFGGDGREARLRVRHQFMDGRLHVPGANTVKRNLKIDVEEWVRFAVL